MVDTDREDWLVGGWALAANGGECAFSLPQLHYSLAEPLACELAPAFRQDNLLEGQVLAAALACLPPISIRRWSFGLSTNKEPCGVTCFLALCKAGISITFSYLHSRVMIVQYCPPAVRCFLWLGLSSTQMPRCC